MIFARIILILLCILSAGLYVRVLLSPEQVEQLSSQLLQTFSSEELPAQESPDSTVATLQPLPDDQMALVIKTLAPEMHTKQ